MTNILHVTSLKEMKQLVELGTTPQIGFMGGRKIVINNRSYSMNEIVFQFQQCIPADPTQEDKVKMKEILSKIKTLDLSGAKKLKEEPLWKRGLTAIRQAIGNLLFKITHRGFSGEKWLHQIEASLAAVAPKEATPKLSKTIDDVIKETSRYKKYEVSLPEKHPCHGAVLTAFSLRPSNLFLAAVFHDPHITTLPGENLFKYNKSHEKVRALIDEEAEKDPDGVVAFTADGAKGFAVPQRGRSPIAIPDFGEIYGKNVYKMSHKEVQSTVESQRIFTSSMLPLEFYRLLKEALQKDGVVVLPGSDEKPLTLEEVAQTHPEVAALLKKSAHSMGFPDDTSLEAMKKMTIYQIGSMVVKTEDFRVFCDGEGKILAREPGSNDAIRLISACGIRGVGSSKTPRAHNKEIMTETFKAVLASAGNGILVVPAVGMGIWGGDPELYWKGFLDAVVATEDSFASICVNPGHQQTPYGAYKGATGNEFQVILDEYIDKARKEGDSTTLKKLEKIRNLHGTGTDIVQLSRNLKNNFPDKTVSLVNASDPDVTLGNHVGEYVNNLPHVPTTEENYTALGTNGLCFEGITGIHKDPARLFHVFERRIA